jgi:uncharacterized delta-60 repeat protein
MIRTLAAAAAALALVPAAAQARPGDPDRSFGRRGSVTLKATNADAVGGAVRVISNTRILAGGAAAGQFVVVRLRPTGSLDSRFGTRGQVVPALPGTTHEGVRALATLRDGRIVAAGTIRLAAGGTRFVAFRLLPNGEVDPSFGGGLGYVTPGPANGQLAAMVADRDGNLFLGGGRPDGAGGELPVLIKLLPDGTPDPTFTAINSGPSGRVTSILLRSNGSITFSIGAGPGLSGIAAFTVVRLLPTGALDPSFGGTGVVSIPMGTGAGAGIGAQVVRNTTNDMTLVAGTDLTSSGTPRGAILRLRQDGSLDTRFGSRGITRIARAGREIRITSMVRDRSGRILVAGSGRPPNAMIARLRAGGARDRTFGNGGITYPLLGRPPGGNPIFTTIEALDVARNRPVLAGSAAGPGQLIRGTGATTYTGRFAFTVSRLD